MCLHTLWTRESQWNPTAQNPTEDFDAETWDVRLTVTGPGGDDTETRTDYILAGAVYWPDGEPMLWPDGEYVLWPS